MLPYIAAPWIRHGYWIVTYSKWLSFCTSPTRDFEKKWANPSGFFRSCVHSNPLSDKQTVCYWQSGVFTGMVMAHGFNSYVSYYGQDRRFAGSGLFPKGPHFAAQAQCFITLVHLCVGMSQDQFFRKINRKSEASADLGSVWPFFPVFHSCGENGVWLFEGGGRLENPFI